MSEAEEAENSMAVLKIRAVLIAGFSVIAAKAISAVFFVRLLRLYSSVLQL